MHTPERYAKKSMELSSAQDPDELNENPYCGIEHSNHIRPIEQGIAKDITSGRVSHVARQLASFSSHGNNNHVSDENIKTLIDPTCPGIVPELPQLPQQRSRQSVIAVSSYQQKNVTVGRGWVTDKFARPGNTTGSERATVSPDRKHAVQASHLSQVIPAQPHFAVLPDFDPKKSLLAIGRQELSKVQTEATVSFRPIHTIEDQRNPQMPIKRSSKSLKESRGKRRAAAAAAAAAKAALSEKPSLESDAQKKGTHDADALKKIQKRVKNRESVEKCRLKKKMRLAGLEVEKENLAEENKKMKEVLSKLESSSLSYTGNI